MYFKFEQLHLDLGETSIENIFLNDFMPAADGNFVKVYLLGYKLAKESQGLKHFDNEVIADALGMIASDVMRAWQYWEKQGIVLRREEEDNTVIEFVNLKQLYINNVYTPSPSSKVSVNKDYNDVVVNPEIANLLSRAEFLMRQPISVPQKRDIAQWIEVYNMPAHLIEEAFFYATEVKQIYSTKYVEGIVRNWAQENIRTMEDIEQSYIKNDEKYYRYNKVMKAIGLQKKALSQVDLELVNSWFDELGFDMTMVYEACKRTSNTRQPSLSYVDAILKAWKDRQIHSVEEIAQKDIKEKKASPRKNKFHNFKQITDNFSEEELEEVARRKRREAFKKIGVDYESLSKDQ